MSMFQEAPLLFTGIAPPPLDRNAAGEPDVLHVRRTGAFEMSTLFGVVVTGPVVQHRDAVLTSSTWPSSSAMMLATRL